MRTLALAAALLATLCAPTALASGELVGRQPDGSVLLPDTQRITPYGRQVETPTHPSGVAINPDGRTAALHGAGGPGLTIVDLSHATVLQTVNGPVSYDGLVYGADGRTLYASDHAGSVFAYPVNGDGTLDAAHAWSVAIPMNPATPPNSYPGGLALSQDGKTLYVALSRDNALGVIDLASKSFSGRIAVGNAPHAVVVSGSKAYVSNEGGRPVRPGDFVNWSGASLIAADPFTGAANTGTVSVVDLAAGKETATIDVGLHPTALALHGNRLYIANTNSDTVSIADTTTNVVVKTFSVRPFKGAPLGSMPNGLATLGGDRLAITLGRTNALAVYDVRRESSPKRVALEPTAWYPADVDANANRIVTANQQGVGSLGDADAGREARGVGSEIGSASIIDLRDGDALKDRRAQVAANNGWDRISTAAPRRGIRATAIPRRIGEPSLIKHVLYVIRENRTYDTVLGDLGRGNSDPKLVEYGRGVTPNAHALATQFPLLDNFYTSGRRSNDGHQWATRAMSPDYLQKQDGATERDTNPAGNFTPPSSGFDALLYSPNGFLWENALRAGKTFEDYGEYTNEDAPPPAHSDIPSLEAHVIPEFQGFNLQTPDQDRASIFKAHLAVHALRDDFPDLTMLTLPNDHTGGSNPQYPTPDSQVADNDAGLGQIIDAVSHSKFWKDTAIFVVEDDSQSGPDHVDGHRSPAFVVSPYARRGVIDSTYYTQVDVVRTIEQILGLRPMNPLDLAATPMRTAFTDKADSTPYTSIPSPLGTNVPNPPLAALTGIRREWAEAMMEQDFDHLDEASEELLNRDLWYRAKGYRTPYPGDSRVLHPHEVQTDTD
jgi:YVTN family beta-propeller protein